MKNEKLTVIVPVYNVAVFLEQCISSLLSQTYPHFEVLAINDGSTDNSQELLYRLQRLDKRLKVFDKKNGGLSATRNFGVERAAGDYIIFLDSDDFLAPNTLEVLEKNIRQHKLDVVKFGAAIFVEGDGLPDKDYYRPQQLLNSVMAGKEFFAESMRHQAFLPSACLCAVKASISKQLTFMPGVYFEDNLYTVQLLFNDECHRVMAIKNELYQRRVRHGSITTTFSHKHYEDKLCIFDQLASFKKTINFSSASELKAYKVFLLDVLRSALHLFYENHEAMPWPEKKRLLTKARNCLVPSVRTPVLWLAIAWPSCYFLLRKLAKKLSNTG